ncbi:SMI1/KNR4 family protein [candidate division CSSED10-310 bacterium]|uniref:SMI1/KNR4 family protein n=1 Tax=candidate division CSSED10-310 bacterium TaxID=2855610 RepID=A0ABV6Z3T7_UNCC1
MAKLQSYFKNDVLVFEEKYGKIPEDYKWFLKTVGGCPIGSEWIANIKELEKTHIEISDDRNVPKEWKMKSYFIIGFDGWGNYFGICTETGKIFMEDHNFGGIHEIAASFEDYILKLMNQMIF